MSLPVEPTCLDWHDKCEAMCCKMFTIPKGIHDKGRVRGDYYVIKYPNIVSKDLKWYFTLHGCRVVRNQVRIPLKGTLTEEEGDKVLVYRRCNYLTEDLRCEGHPHAKPEVCKALTWETASDERFYVTRGCMYEKVR